MDELTIFWTHTAKRQRDYVLLIGTVEIKAKIILES